jgi:hypothetical protein
MRMSACSLALAIVLAAGAAAGALAQTAAENAARWGLLGDWRLDCGRPVDNQFSSLSYRVAEGRLFHDRDFGHARDSHPVASARILGDGSIELVISFRDPVTTREFSLIRGRDGRIRAMSNRDVSSNQFTIQGGRFTANGRQTPWQARCG